MMSAEPGRYIALGRHGVIGLAFMHDGCIARGCVNQALLQVKAGVGRNVVSDMGNSGRAIVCLCLSAVLGSCEASLAKLSLQMRMWNWDQCLLCSPA